MSGRQRGALRGLGLLAALVLLGHAPAALAVDPSVASGNAKLKEIIEAARKEGQLSLVVGQGSLGGSAKQLAKGYNAYYGLNLDVRFTPGPDMANMSVTIVQQTQAKRPATTDVITGYANHMTNMIDAGALQTGDWAAWAPNLQKPGLVSQEGAAVPIMSSTPGIAYNSDVLKGDDVPKTFHDLLNPKLKGRVVATPYASSFDRLATDDLWGKEKTLEFAKQLSANIGGLMRCNEMDRLSSGEFDVFGLTCSQGNALGPSGKGAPIGFVLASDAPIVMYLYEGVPTTSAHPNAAKLWINYILSREAQDMLYAETFQDLHLLEGSKTEGLIKDAEGRGAKFLLVDTKFYRTHDAAEMDKVLSEVQEIFRNK